LAKRAVKRAYPELGEIEREIRFVEVNYGKEIACGYAGYLKKRNE
jgi:hypothetical protein